jgi:uracil-DNA glycosylase
MDETIQKEVAAWLAFYRELGIDGFYRRPPGSPSALPPTVAARDEGDEKDKLTPEPLLAGQQGAAPLDSPLRTLSPETSTPSSGARTPTPQQRGASLEPRASAALPGAPARVMSLFDAPAEPRRGHETLEEIRADLGDCHRCKLAGGRKTIVFGEGNPHARVMFIGEGPGADEDEQGRPFVGRAGQLLNRMLQLVGIKREDVYIANVVKCRPPGNRAPEKDEVEACSPFLYRQIETIKPRLICCLGAPAVKTILGAKEGILKIRGQLFEYGGTKVMPTVHPAYVLRNPRDEKLLREDFEKICDFLRTS